MAREGRCSAKDVGIGGGGLTDLRNLNAYLQRSVLTAHGPMLASEWLQKCVTNAHAAALPLQIRETNKAHRLVPASPDHQQLLLLLGRQLVGQDGRGSGRAELQGHVRGRC